MMTAFNVLKELNTACCGFFSTEKPKERASNGELKRWLDKGSVVINGARPKPFDEVGVIKDIVLFPKSDDKRRTFRFNC